MSPPQHIHWKPDTDALRQCIDYGATLAEVWNQDESYNQPKVVEQQVTRLEASDTQTEAPTSEQVDTPMSEQTEQGEQTEQRLPHADDCTCWRCTVCEWVYDPKQGEPNQDVAPGTPWEQVPDSFLCPECHLGKEVFVEV